MERLTKLIDRLSTLEGELYKVIEDVVRQYGYVIEEMNSEDQLFERGVNRDGVDIASYAPYHPFTLEVKTGKGQPTNRVTLRDEGDFHKSIYIEFQPDGFEIKASDWKTLSLVQMYDPEILGLTDANFKEFAIDYVKPDIIEFMKKLNA